MTTADIASMIEENMKTPDEWQLTPDKIGALLDVALGAGDDAKAKIVNSLRPIVGLLSEDERENPVITTPLKIILGNQEAVDRWLDGAGKPPGAPAFEPLSFDELMAMPDKEWLIDQVIGKGDIGMIYGAPGCGKTFVGINMIVAACTGSEWAGRFQPARALNVAYCAGEGVSGLPARFRAALDPFGVSTLPNFTFYKTIPQLYNDEDTITTYSIRQFVTEWLERLEAGAAKPLDVLFIDTLHTASTAADENSAKDMGVVLRACRDASTALGCAVVLVHHTNKGGTAERGSSALRGAMDFMIEIKRPSEESTRALMRCAKLKDGEAWKDQLFDLFAVEGCDSVCVLWDKPGEGTQITGAKAADKEQLLAMMKANAGGRFTVKSLAGGIDKKENYTRKLLTELSNEGLCQQELKQKGKDAGGHNPWLYFVSAQQSEMGLS